MQPRQNNQLKILCIYANSQTYTSTVFEHLDAFRQYSQYKWYFLDFTFVSQSTNFSYFDVVVIHYSVRLPFGQLNETTVDKLSAYLGLKVLFIQDEYDHTNRTKSLIRKVGFHLVLTAVPAKSITLIYPPDEFSRVEFVSNFTGYIPEDLSSVVGRYVPPSRRNCVVAYRGRALPIRYGRLGQDKARIGQVVKEYCEANGIPHNIAWTEESRIYGADWYKFVASSIGMLGSESGSNVFDWDGTLENKIAEYRRRVPTASDDQVYSAVVEPYELHGAMNQISPRIFEMVAARTAMVLLEGNYSGILVPNLHYIPLKRDFSNIEEVFAKLGNGDIVDEMTIRAYEDIFLSGKYCYRKFVKMVDQKIEEASECQGTACSSNNFVWFHRRLCGSDRAPTRAESPFKPQIVPPDAPKTYLFKSIGLAIVSTLKGNFNRGICMRLKSLYLITLYAAWAKTPRVLRFILRKMIRRTS